MRRSAASSLRSTRDPLSGPPSSIFCGRPAGRLTLHCVHKSAVRSGAVIGPLRRNASISLSQPSRRHPLAVLCFRFRTASIRTCRGANATPRAWSAGRRAPVSLVHHPWHPPYHLICAKSHIALAPSIQRYSPALRGHHVPLCGVGHAAALGSTWRRRASALRTMPREG